MVPETPHGGDPEEVGREEVRDLIRNWVPQTRGSGVGERLPANGVGVGKRRAGRGTAQRLGARTGGERSHWLQNRFRTQPAASMCAQISPLRKTSPKTGFSQQQPGRREQRLSPLRGVCASSGRRAGSVPAGLGHGGWEGRAVPAPHLHAQTRPTTSKHRAG